jgi:hypothetical protein
MVIVGLWRPLRQRPAHHGERDPAPRRHRPAICGASKLPLFQRLRARLLVELRMQQDQYETHLYALKGVAIGRVVPTPGKRRGRAQCAVLFRRVA